MKSGIISVMLTAGLLLCCTGCGKQVTQTNPAETTTEISGILETTAETVTTESTKAVTSTAKTDIAQTSTTATDKIKTAEVSEISSGIETEILATQILQDEENPLETVILYYYANVDKNQKNNTKRTTAVSRATSPRTTTVTTTVRTIATTKATEKETEVPPETIPEVTEAPAESETEMIPLTGSAEEILEAMTLEQKIYQMFIVTPELLTGAGTVTAAGSWTQQSVYAQPVGGLVYFADNLVTRSQTADMLANTQQYARNTGVGMFLAVDEEGGLVARCAKKLGTTSLSPMAVYGERNDWNEAYGVGQTLGYDIQQFGFNLDFAPVADINLNSGNELGTRIFSSDPEVVGNMVSGVVQGLQDTGVAATLKHFPGLGAEDGNAHYDTEIIIDRSLDDLRNAECIPFRYGIEAGADFVMVSHQIITGAGDGLPSCLSPVICTDLLRNELGFDGILITDSFQMNTISGRYAPAESAVMAVEAGVDIILMPTDLTGSVQAIADAVYTGRIGEERINQSVERILREKEKMNLLG